MLVAAGLRQSKPDIVDVGVLAEAAPQPLEIVDAAAPARQALDHEAPASDVAEPLHLPSAEPAVDEAARFEALLLLQMALSGCEILQGVFDRPHERRPRVALR